MLQIAPRAVRAADRVGPQHEAAGAPKRPTLHGVLATRARFLREAATLADLARFARQRAKRGGTLRERKQAAADADELRWDLKFARCGAEGLAELALQLAATDAADGAARSLPAPP